MLSEQSAVTVRATLPAVGAALGEITERFYAGMFAARPELLRDLFNRGNQAAGTQRQALAGSVAAFATHLLDHPDERPDAMLSRIAHKHASLGVTPDQYAIVHEHLFAAIAEVLGDAVTPEVAAAWDEVYWLMANALIAVEKRLYEERGGAAWRPWEVVERVAETADVVTFRVRPADGGPVRGFLRASTSPCGSRSPTAPARYGSTAFPARPARTCGSSASSACTRTGRPTARCPATSTRVRVGDVLELSEAYGDLVLDADDDTPLVLASAGIGVTPIVAMLGHLADSGHRAPVTVVHGDRSPADHALRTDHEAYAAKLPDATVRFWYERDAPAGAGTGYVDLADVPVAPGTRAYLCGPLPFMRTVREQLIAKGVAPADVHYEVFGPDLWLAK